MHPRSLLSGTCLPVWYALSLSVRLLGADDARFPEPYNTEKPGAEPMAPEAAARSFQLPDGFRVSVFAAEPDIRQPIAMTFDPRGRLWVAENYTYAESKVNFATNLNDRIVILEDTDGDGHFDRRKVFWDQARILTSVEVGGGGVFVLAPPRLLFFPDRNGDDRPDGEPEVLLDGFDLTDGNRHTFANGLKWGPDGWLWGRIGISSGARIGPPGTPAAGRIEMRGGLWRYHPGRHRIEAVCHGTTNPWGLDWNEVGEPFFINTVIGHLWHAIPGAHFQRMHGDDVNPRSYGLIGQHADHYHFDTGAGWTKSRAALDGSAFAAGSDALGGGHAHAGLLIYQGDNWPAEYRGRLFTLNLHGRRVNTERLERDGSGYVGRHGRDLFAVGDPWFRGLDLIQGPDGGVFISDWSDTGECHDSDGVHRTSGRIFKVTYGTPVRPAVEDLTRLDERELVAQLFDRNIWLARQAQRVLADRSAGAPLRPETTQALRDAFVHGTNEVRQLRALWALNATGAATADWLRDQVGFEDEHVLSWLVRLLADTPEAAEGKLNDTFFRLAQLPDRPLVRLYLASALQKLPPATRGKLADALATNAADVGDHNLPLLLWQGIEPLISVRPEAGVGLARATVHRILRQFIARRLAEDLAVNPAPLNHLLRSSLELTGPPVPRIQDVLRGLGDALRGYRHLAPPEAWTDFAAAARTTGDAEAAGLVRDLGGLFGEGRALDDLRRIVADAGADALSRRQALASLLESRADNLAPLLKQVSADAVLRPAAAVGLLQIGDPEAPARALGAYEWLGLEERPAVLAALAGRPAAATALLDALAQGRIPRADVTPFLARQMAGLGDPTLTRRLGEVWGSVHPDNAGRRAAIERERARLTPARLAAADRPRGRAAFVRTCAPCHKLYGAGGEVGPDLTGSGRADLGYLLENIIDPSAVVPAEQRLAVVTLKDGNVLNGILRDRAERTVVVQNQAGRTSLARANIQTLEELDQSLMPEGLLETLAPDEARDLIAYLMSPAQVPLPAPAGR